MQKRTSNITRLSLLPEGFINLPADVAVLKEQIKSIGEVKADVKAILASVEEIKIGIVTRPTFAEVSQKVTPVSDRVSVLEENKAEVKGGWKAAMKAGGIAGGIITAGYYAANILHLIK